jgi:hypothetical protein
MGHETRRSGQMKNLKKTPISRQGLCSKYQRDNRIKQNTPAILKIANILDSLNIHYIREKGFMKNLKSFVLADFYLPRPYKIVIEVDGGYHNDPRQKNYDNYKDKYYKSRKFKVLRLTNQQVLENDFNLILPKD